MEDRERAQALGSEDYITKPFSLKQLMTRIRVLLGHTRGPGPIQARGLTSLPWNAAEKGTKDT